MAAKLVFIYGPPASGKLTVARKLARLTGFKLYDNHVSIQFVTSLFEFGTKTFHRLLDKYRREMLEQAAREGINAIFTFVYGEKADDEFVGDIIKRVRRHNGKVFFVRLRCNREELARRIERPDRRAHGKLTQKKILDDLYLVHDLDAEIPFQSSLSIDTAKRQPGEAAQMIIQHYTLRSSNSRAGR